MSVRDLMPDGFSESHVWYARIARTFKVYPQSFDGRIAIWLDVDGIQAMIGYGPANEAIAEAQQNLRGLIEELPRKVDELLNRT